MKYTVAGTKKLAKNLLKKIKPGKRAAVIALRGNLGTGKTTFTQALAKNLGVKEKVSSPTFVIEKIYQLSKSNFQYLVHIDCYRLDGAEDLIKLGWREIAADPGKLIVIEWPERVKKLLPKNALQIEFEHVDKKHRKIAVNKL